MKQLLFIILTALSTTAFGQTKKEKEVVAAVEALKQAMISGEKKALESIAAEQLSYGHSGGTVEGKAEFVEKIASGKSDFVTIDLTEQTITVSNDVAIVRHVLNATNNDGGKPGTVKLKVLLIFQKQKGSWKLLARQAVKI